jgi:hypothetical protein
LIGLIESERLALKASKVGIYYAHSKWDWIFLSLHIFILRFYRYAAPDSSDTVCC